MLATPDKLHVHEQIVPVDAMQRHTSVCAVQELQSSRQLQISTAVSVLSIAAFNYCGISVTKHLSGAARATIDACRTLFIWAFSLLVRLPALWQPVL